LKNTIIVIITIFLLAGCVQLTKSSEDTDTLPEAGASTISPTPLYTHIQTLTDQVSYPPTSSHIVMPTWTSTPVPPLTAHSWAPQDILVEYGGYGGDGGWWYGDLFPSHFTLLSTGELFILYWDDVTASEKLFYVSLSQESVCNLLNSIDQAGFFDYDPDSFIKDPDHWFSPVEGAGYGYINVNAWRYKNITHYAAFTYITEGDSIKALWADECGECPLIEFPTILPALRDTYSMLSAYRPDTLAVYQPDRIGIWVDTIVEPNNHNPWPFKEPRLADLSVRNLGLTYGDLSGLMPDLILFGNQASLIYDMLGQSIDGYGIVFTEGDKGYLAYVRPLLPNEYKHKVAPLVDSMRCSPEDGWVTPEEAP
jgi:hypothetical protein